MKHAEFTKHPIWADLKTIKNLLHEIDKLADATVSSRLDNVCEILSETDTFRESVNSRLFSANMVAKATDLVGDAPRQLDAIPGQPG